MNAEAVRDSRPPRRLYAHAPIVEAVLEIRVAPRPDTDVASLRAIYDAEKAAYDRLHEAHEFRSSVEFSSDLGASNASGHQQLAGYQLVDTKNARSALLGLAGFRCSKFEPYTRWEALRDEGKRLWAKYEAAVHPVGVRRLGLRYINRIDIPLPADHLKKYLRTGPDVSPGISQLISGYALELHMPQPDLPGTTAVMRQASVEPPREGIISVVLDIDVYIEQLLKPPFDRVWEAFETLHDRENFIFESTITDKVRELID